MPPLARLTLNESSASRFLYLTLFGLVKQGQIWSKKASMTLSFEAKYTNTGNIRVYEIRNPINYQITSLTPKNGVRISRTDVAAHNKPMQ